MGIQNYSNLTLDNINISGGSNIRYVVSNNYGNVTFKNKTTITAASGKVAFDAWYGLASDGSYDVPGVFVTVADPSVTINGKVEFGKQDRASLENFKDHAFIKCPEEMDLTITPSTSDCDWVHDSSTGMKSFKYLGSE